MRQLFIFTLLISGFTATEISLEVNVPWCEIKIRDFAASWSHVNGTLWEYPGSTSPDGPTCVAYRLHCNGFCSVTIPENTILQIEGEAIYTGYHFIGWEGDLPSMVHPFPFLVDTTLGAGPYHLRAICDANTCSPGLRWCFDQCVDRNTDTNNCGECGTVCDAGLDCDNGSCVNGSVNSTTTVDVPCVA
eukprot:TRINITY_DN9532_c0_g1_i1.p1 TRINITY_DN9532_c0_g1~~TRINITY_DN9532_c0_g1_i1.p1  ORF type:complete len:189 (-),score=29.06 TRINITY_DN9532_c0_g1_i1:85-651(-)